MKKAKQRVTGEMSLDKSALYSLRKDEQKRHQIHEKFEGSGQDKQYKAFQVCDKYKREVLTGSTEKASLERFLKYQEQN